MTRVFPQRHRTKEGVGVGEISKRSERKTARCTTVSTANIILFLGGGL